MRDGMARRVAAAGAALAVFCLLAGSAGAQDNPLQPGETWADLQYDVVGDRPIQDGAGVIEMVAPYRAEDAAIVPIEIRQAPGFDGVITKLTLVVDENPAPVVAEFEFGPAMGPLTLSTRVRVDRYSNVRIIAETADGGLYMSGAFVKASGGCSAPSLKDMDAALAHLGDMKVRFYDAAADQQPERVEAQVMLRHPNYSGMQMNQLTQLYIPARFVDRMEVRQGDELLFRMSGGISISEDPSIRFFFRPNGADSLSIEARDTDGQAFAQSFPISEGKI